MHCRWCWIEQNNNNTYSVKIKWEIRLRAKCKLCYNNWWWVYRRVEKNKLYPIYIKLIEESKFLDYRMTYSWLAQYIRFNNVEINEKNVLSILRKFNIKSLINKEANTLFEAYKKRGWDLNKYYWLKKYKELWEEIDRCKFKSNWSLTPKEIALVEEYKAFKKWWLFKTKSSYFEVVHHIMLKDLLRLVYKYNYDKKIKRI